MTNLVLLCCVVTVNRLIGWSSSVQRFNAAMQKTSWCVLDFSGASISHSDLFFNTSVFLCFGHGMEEDLTDPWSPRTQEILLSFRTITNEAERTLNLPTHGAARAPPLEVNGVSCGCVGRERGGYQYRQRQEHATSGGASAPEPARATRSQSDPYKFL